MNRCALLALLCAVPGLARAQDVGDIVISELMIRSVSAPEWVELHNPTGAELSLDGCVLSDSGTDLSLAGVSIPAGGYALLSDDDALCVTYEDAAGSTCTHPSEGVFAALSLSDAAPDTLELRCGATLVDTVTFDWSQLIADCDGAPTCSANLAPEALTAAGNDDWPGAWCVAPVSSFTYDTLGREMVGTPGEPNVCPSAGAGCGQGDAVFTELMVAPPSSTREWFELRVLNPDGCDLQDCVLREGPFLDPSFDPTHPEWATHVIDGPGNTLPLGAGQYALFAKGADTVVGAPGDPEVVLADYRYPTLTFSNSEAGYLHLTCAGVPVDSAPYDWTRFVAGCPDGGCSMNLLPDREDAATNDDLGQWCLPPDESVYPTSDGQLMTATPGFAGGCQQRAWPGPGQIVFTELQGLPDSGSTGTTIPEYFELFHVGGASVELTGCRITRERLDRETGEWAPTSTSSEAVFGDNTESTTMAEGEVMVWTGSGRCLDGRDREVTSCDGELAFSGISLSNSESERLSLFCPDGATGEVLVDRIPYDFGRQGARAGHAMEFDPSDGNPGSLNDELDAWCEASFLTCYATNGEGQCNFGTPFAVGECLGGQLSAPQSGVPGCRCDSVAPNRGSGWLAALLLLGLGLLRRTERA